MRFVFLLFLLAAQVVQGAETAFPAELDRFIENARREWNVPGLAVTIVKDDAVVVAKGYGVRKLGEAAPVDAHTRFDIASLTKSFTSAAAGTLVDAGKLSWDDRVRERLPSVEFGDPNIDSKVTLRDLLSHRVAVAPANAMWYFTRYDSAEVLRRVRLLEPQRQFRADLVYWNVGYLIAGELEAKAAGMPWAELVRTKLLEPAGMRESTVGEAWSQTGNVAWPHIAVAGQQKAVVPHLTINVAPAGAPGGVISTASDMARWMRLQLGGGEIDGTRVVSEAALDETHSPQIATPMPATMRAARHVEHSVAYGMGWNVMDYRGEPMLWHSGNADGMPVYMALLPRKKLGVVVMVNTWAAPYLHGALAGRILDHYLGVTPLQDSAGEALAAQKRSEARNAEEIRKLEAQRVPDTKPSRPLDAYVGKYVDRVIGDVHVRKEGNGLTLQVAGGEVADLLHWHYDTFQVEWRDPFYREIFRTSVTFTIGLSGRPERLRMPLNRDMAEGVRAE